MSKGLGKRLGSGFLMVCLLAFPAGLSAQKIKITVVGKDANIQLGPDAGSRIVQAAAVGSVLEAEQKVGEWYEIKLPSKLGVIITGYIHEKFVETEKDKIEKPKEAAAPPQKPLPPKVAEPAKESPPRQKRAWKGDFAVRFGYLPGSLASTQSSYTANWNNNLLKSVSETGTVKHGFGGSMGPSFSLSYFLAGGLGLQVKLDYQLTTKVKAGEDSSGYKLAWTWSDGSGSYNASEEWALSGEYAVSPLSLNLIYRGSSAGSVIPYISAGVSYFTGKLKVETTRGYAFTWQSDPNQYIDYLDVPMKVDASVSGIGFNAGAGLDLVLFSNVALNIEAAYFSGKTMKESWQHMPGTYPGNIFPAISWSVDQAYADKMSEQVTQLEVKTSFFKVLAGIKFLF